MPFRHVALYRWAGDVGDDHLERLGEALDQLAAQLPGAHRVTHGRDVGASGGSFDYVVVVDVDTVVDWRTLRDHPSYILLVEELITPHVVEHATGQFRIDDPSAVAPGDVDVRALSDDELMDRARRSAQAGMDALLAEPDDIS